MTGIWNVVAEGDKGPAYEHTLMLKYTLVVASGVTAYLHAQAGSRGRWPSSATHRNHRAGHPVRRNHARPPERSLRSPVPAIMPTTPQSGLGQEHQMPTSPGCRPTRQRVEDVEAVFGSGGAHKCRCQALKVPGWIWRDTTQEQRDAALLEQTACGTTGPTSGLIGYVDGEAAGWVAVEPRENYPRLWSRKQPWMRMDPELEGSGQSRVSSCARGGASRG